MICSHCQDAEDFFSAKLAEEELAEFRKNGARKTTRILLDRLKQAGITGLSLLDIGGGIGAIPHELIPAGLRHASLVDASRSYLRVAQEEAQARGYAEKIDGRYGDFVQLASSIEATDIVTLDRVVCCYPDALSLVALSAERAKRFYALVYPRDNALFRWGVRLLNVFAFRLRGSAFRLYIHQTSMIDAKIRAQGLHLLEHRKVGLWQVFVYQRGE
jgi:hypothetical protein